MDCVVFFDDVDGAVGARVPARRRRPLNGAAQRHAFLGAFAHQGAAKNLAKCEFVLGVALLMTEALGNAHLPHVEERIGELMMYTNLTRACMRAARRTRSSTNGA